MEKWRNARDECGIWSAEEQEELERLIEIELEGSGKRIEKLANQLGR